MFETDEQNAMEMQVEVDAEEQDTEASEADETTVEAGGQEQAEAQQAGEKVGGAVMWGSTPKGRSFISRKGGEDVFVHYSEIDGSGLRSLNAGVRVKFAIRQSEWDGVPGFRSDAAGWILVRGLMALVLFTRATLAVPVLVW